jgi:hypothetical protein
MKPFRFSLTMLLLMMALCATTIAWLHALDRKDHFDYIEHRALDMQAAKQHVENGTLDEKWLAEMEKRREEEYSVRLRFSFRDVIWLPFVVALVVGWWLDHRSLKSQIPVKLLGGPQPESSPQKIASPY